MYAAFAEIQDLPTASYRTYATFAEVEDISKLVIQLEEAHERIQLKEIKYEALRWSTLH